MSLSCDEATFTEAFEFLAQAKVNYMFNSKKWSNTSRGLLAAFANDVTASIDNPTLHGSSIQEHLATLQSLCRERPGYVETARLMESVLAHLRPLVDDLPLKKWENWKPLASQIHDAIHLIFTSGAWNPTSKQSFFTLIRIADPEMAEYWLQTQWKQCSMLPDRYDYTAVIQTWSRAVDREDAGERAGKVVHELLERYQATLKDPRLKPTEAAYVGWIVAIGLAGSTIRTAEKASEVIQLAWDNAERDKFWPSTTMYNAVLHEWAQARNPEMAEDTLREMMEKSAKNPFCTPDTKSFSIVIDAWSKSDDPKSPEKAEGVLSAMEDHALSTLQFHLRPSVITYSSVLNCWAKSNNPDAPLRAEAILRHMKEQYDQGRHKFPPNIVSYNSCMNAWARSGNASAPEEVERLFREVGDSNLKPNHITYMTRINVLERSRRRSPQSCAARALHILNEMIRDPDIYPNRLHYNRVLVALGLAGDTDNAEKLLFRMISDVVDRDLQESGPDMFSFHCVMSAHAKQLTTEAAERCERLLDHMCRLANDAEYKWSIAPNTVSYNTTLNAWARSRDKITLEKVENLVARMRSAQIPLDDYSYGAMIQAIAASALPRKEKHDRALKVLATMRIEKIDVNGILIRRAQECLMESYSETMKARPRTVT